MSKGTAVQSGKYAYTQNREISWLRFNRRVLEEAADETVPLLERLKFIAIFSSNLDEFFMVRVGSLFDVSSVSPDEIDNKTGMTAAEQMERIYQTVPGLIALKKQIYTGVMGNLRQAGIADLSYDELKAPERSYIDRYFRSNILPVISPIIVGSHHPVPHLVNKKLYIAALLKDRKGKQSTGLIPVPDSLPDYVSFPETPGRYIRMETIILQWTPLLFGAYRAESACVISVTRNADLSFDNEKFEDNEESFRSRMMKLLKKRDSLSVIRLEINQAVSETFLSALRRLVQVGKHQVYVDTCPINMKYVYSLIASLPASVTSPLLFEPYQSRWPEDIRRGSSIIEQIQQQDKLLFYPFDSVDPFLRLLNEAAERPDVLSIKITIYRLASSSKIAHTLCRAAENGKEVVVLMELRARFDEANNISWSKLLEDAGCQVIYGVEDFKCHSKICLITMRSKGKLRYITQIGTGNYNEKTNAMYTDLSMMTAAQAIGEDGTAFFQNMLVNNLEGSYKQLLVAPKGMKTAICRLMDEEIAKGKDGYICIKANAVTEREVIDKLREASQAGVEVQLIIRGICCLLPGIPLYTENIHVTSIVGRFLEHARIYCFGRGNDTRLYLSSADMMTRNLNRRVEIACPVTDAEIKDQLLWILATQLTDNSKASFLLSDGTYSRKNGRLTGVVNSQERFMEISIHHAVETAPAQTGALQKMRAWLHKRLKK